MVATRKAKTETPVRAKSAVVKIELQSKMASSKPSFEAITHQITYLMSTIANQNVNNNGQMVQDVHMEMENFLMLELKGQRRVEKT